MHRNIKCRFFTFFITQNTVIIRNGCCRLRSCKKVDTDLSYRKDLVMDQSAD